MKENILNCSCTNNDIPFEFNHYKMKELEGDYGSSFYIFDVEKLRENYQKLMLAFKSRYENFIIGYSYKTNYLPFLCKELSKLGTYAEVVSRLEYDLALKIGVEPGKIIFNGPLKSKDDIFYALNHESMVNIDSKYELEYVKDFAKIQSNRQVKIGIRLNFDISHGGVSYLQDGYQVSRFGICVENGNLQTLLAEINEVRNISVVGLHGHFSTKNRCLETYKKITQTLCQISKDISNNQIEYIDIGGGIYGELPRIFQKKAPTFDDYAEVICEIMNKEFLDQKRMPALILEPGISLVANVFYFVAKVIDVKNIQDHIFVLVDGSVHNVKPTMHKNIMPMRIIRRKEGTLGKRVFNIVGFTCMEKDYLAYEIYDALPQRDDYIIFENVGAYTIVFNPPFIKERPPIIAADNTQIFVVREKETIKQFFNEELYKF